MPHINSIGAGMFSDLSMALPATPFTSAVFTEVTPGELHLELGDHFDTKRASTYASANATGDFVRIENVREFPSMGTPPNIVNVPVYGQATSQQIQGQADAPSIELTLNYVATDWASGTKLGDAVGDGNQYLFRFALLNSEPASYTTIRADVAAGDGIGGSTGDGTATNNSVYYWLGKVEALSVSPQLTDSNTATVTISIQSDFYGAYTYATAA